MKAILSNSMLFLFANVFFWSFPSTLQLLIALVNSLINPGIKHWRNLWFSPYMPHAQIYPLPYILCSLPVHWAYACLCLFVLCCNLSSACVQCSCLPLPLVLILCVIVSTLWSRCLCVVLMLHSAVVYRTPCSNDACSCMWIVPMCYWH